MIEFIETGLLNQKEVLDKIMRDLGRGSSMTLYQDTLRTAARNALDIPLPQAKESQAQVFVTRPLLNLSTGNLRESRILDQLAVDDIDSLQRYVRCTLDPMSNRGHGTEEIQSSYVNPYDPFIPIIPNTLLTLSGWPDIVLKTETSTEGVMKESWKMASGTHEVNTGFTLTTNFRNIEGDPLLLLIFSWIVYMSSIRLEDMNPWAYSILANRKDYESRFYELILDPTGRFVTKWADCAAAFPNTIPIGNYFNVNTTEVDVKDKEQLTINWEAQMARYNDPLTLIKFNVLQGKYDNRKIILESSLTPDGNIEVMGEKNLIRMSSEDMSKVQHRGSPLIHPMTQELIWYLTREEYLKLG